MSSPPRQVAFCERYEWNGVGPCQTRYAGRSCVDVPVAGHVGEVQGNTGPEKLDHVHLSFGVLKRRCTYNSSLSHVPFCERHVCVGVGPCQTGMQDGVVLTYLWQTRGRRGGKYRSSRGAYAYVCLYVCVSARVFVWRLGSLTGYDSTHWPSLQTTICHRDSVVRRKNLRKANDYW